MKEIQMSVKEADRLGVMRRIDKKELTIQKASEELGLSLRQTKRLRKRYLREGERGLISLKRGQESNRKTPDKLRDKILMLAKSTYENFGPTLLSEKLKERDEIEISAETLRQWLIAEGIHRSKKRKKQRVYQRRTRRSRFGELLQGDGSPEAWFEDRAEKCSLLQFVDDATGQTTAAKFVPTETAEGYLEILQEHMKKYGRPMSLYVDKHSIFRVNREELKKGTGITHVGRILKELGIELICANSPQAKGRVERRNGVFQDRLIKEMRLLGISSIEGGNEFLPKFLMGFNQRFGKEAANSEDAHRPLRVQDDLKRIFSRKDKRVLSKDLTFQHQGILYMIETKSPNRLRHAAIEVFWREGEPIEAEYKGGKLQYKKWEEIAYERPKIRDSKEMEISGWINKKVTKPAKNHAWR